MQDTVENFDPFADEGQGEGTGYELIDITCSIRIFSSCIFGPVISFRLMTGGPSRP